MARLARRFLWLLRRALWIAGAVAVGYGCWRCFNAPIATAVVWWCVGLPLLPPTGWLFGRGRWPALGLGVVLWFAASLLPGDHAYGFLLRVFGSFIACSSLLVWRTLWNLTKVESPGL